MQFCLGFLEVTEHDTELYVRLYLFKLVSYISIVYYEIRCILKHEKILQKRKRIHCFFPYCFLY